eukprot:4736794-Prymnesium_polylepis.2
MTGRGLSMGLSVCFDLPDLLSPVVPLSAVKITSITEKERAPLVARFACCGRWPQTLPRETPPALRFTDCTVRQ